MRLRSVSSGRVTKAANDERKTSHHYVYISTVIEFLQHIAYCVQTRNGKGIKEHIAKCEI